MLNSTLKFDEGRCTLTRKLLWCKIRTPRNWNNGSGWRHSAVVLKLVKGQKSTPIPWLLQKNILSTSLGDRQLCCYFKLRLGFSQLFGGVPFLVSDRMRHANHAFLGRKNIAVAVGSCMALKKPTTGLHVSLITQGWHRKWSSCGAGCPYCLSCCSWYLLERWDTRWQQMSLQWVDNIIGNGRDGSP